MKIAILFCLIIVSSPSFANCETVATFIQESVEREVGKLDGTIIGESWRQLGNRELCRLTFDSDNLLSRQNSLYLNKIEQVLRFDQNDAKARSCHRVSNMITSDYNSGVRGGDWFFYITDDVFEKFVFDGYTKTRDVVWSDVDYSTIRWNCYDDVPVGALCRTKTIFNDEYAMRSLGSEIRFLWWATTRTIKYRVEAIERLDGCGFEGLFGTEESYELRIVNRDGIKTGFWRSPDKNRGSKKNYYVVVEAIGANGNPLSLAILNEENGNTETVSVWGIRVPESTYRAVAADKQDDGILQQDILGLKETGSLEVRYLMPVLGGAVTRWGDSEDTLKVEASHNRSESDTIGTASQIRECINMPPGAEEAGSVATVEFEINNDGQVSEQPTVLSSTDDVYARAVVRAIMRCGPYREFNGETVQAKFAAREF